MFGAPPLIEWISDGPGNWEEAPVGKKIEACTDVGDAT